MAINFDEFGFFDGVTRVDQVNWPKYMNATQPDGVVCSEEVVIEYGGAMNVYANSSGMKVFVHPGFCYVHSHYGISRSVRELPIQAAHGSLPRIDLVVARARYDAAPNSVLELDVVSGVPSAGPEAPEPRQEAGVIWEIPLARVRVNAGAVTIANSNVTDVRTCSKLPIEQGGTGATSKEGARANLGITYGTRQVTVNRIAGGNTAPAYCQGLPDGGMVWIEPVDECWEVCSYSGVRYYSHSANILKVKATTTVISPITLNVGWIKVV